TFRGRLCCAGRKFTTQGRRGTKRASYHVCCSPADSPVGAASQRPDAESKSEGETMVRVLASIGLAIAVTSGPLAQPSTNPAQANKSIASYVYLVNAEGDKILVTTQF